MFKTILLSTLVAFTLASCAHKNNQQAGCPCGKDKPACTTAKECPMSGAKEKEKHSCCADKEKRDCADKNKKDCADTKECSMSGAKDKGSCCGKTGEKEKAPAAK